MLKWIAGTTESHVFCGAVEVKLKLASTDSEKENRVVTLRENESVRVKQPSGAGGLHFTSLHTAAKADRFVRTLRPPLHVLAYFRLGEDDPGAVTGKPAAKYTVNHGHFERDLRKYGSPTYTAGPRLEASWL